MLPSGPLIPPPIRSLVSAVRHTAFTSAEVLSLPRFGEALSRITERFEAAGAIGLLVLEAAWLAEIERNFGAEAFRHTMNRLFAWLGDAVQPYLREADELLLGEAGSGEFLVLLYRGREELDRIWSELPELAGQLEERFPERGARIAYPYLRSAPAVALGHAMALRNPSLSVETQLRRVLDRAREDADLNRKLLHRQRRDRLLDIVLRGRVRSVYEPIVTVKDRTVFGYEALARGPEGSDLYAPLSMFELAEEVGLVFELDCLCRRSGIAGAAALPPGAKLFLNFLPTAIRDPAFRGEALCRTLESIRLQPSDVVFEISERESIRHFALFRELRDYYGSLGFKIALDDTGAGYSSLQAVMELAPDFIKVDRVFVTGADEDPSRRELLRAFHAVAEQMGSRVIAEGLDTPEELAVLEELGIPFGQGWLFGRPSPQPTPPETPRS